MGFTCQSFDLWALSKRPDRREGGSAVCLYSCTRHAQAHLSVIRNGCVFRLASRRALETILRLALYPRWAPEGIRGFKRLV